MASCVRCDKPLTEPGYSLAYRQAMTGKANRTVAIASGLCKTCMARISSFIRLAPGRCRKCRGWAPIMCDDGRKVCECEPL